MIHPSLRPLRVCMWVFPVLLLSSNVSAQVSAERVLPGEAYIPGETIQVTIKITGIPGAVTVVESPPAGWTTSRISNNGQIREGTIIWELPSFTGILTLKYSVTPPNTAMGEGIFSGNIGNEEIGGMSTLVSYQVPADLRMPRTTGPYAVGTLLVHLVDESREEQSTPKNPDDKRELMVQLWYPADNRAGMQPGVVYPGFEIIQPIMEVGYPSYPTPHVYWDEIRGLVGNAVWNAPLLDTGWQYPLVIYSHGHTAWRHCNLSLLEELASHGYIVASIDHTYNAAAVLFPDGRVIVANGGMDVNLHAQDVRFVLDRLGVIPPGSDLGLFAGRLDLERAGVLGMSFGGDVMAKVMQTDTRFKAGAGLDGGTASKCGRPVMFLWNTAYPGSPGLLEKNLLGGGYSCQIRDTTHIDFSNYPLWWKVFALPGKFSTSIAEDPIRIDRIISEYTLAFFNKMLKGQATPLLSGPSRDYPEVDLTIIGNPHGLSGIRAAEWARY